jgi:hypothetical protein
MRFRERSAGEVNIVFDAMVKAPLQLGFPLTSDDDEPLVDGGASEDGDDASVGDDAPAGDEASLGDDETADDAEASDDDGTDASGDEEFSPGRLQPDIGYCLL